MRKTYMTGAEYRAALKALGLSMRQGARFMRVDTKTVQRRALEQRGIEWDTATLLRLMLALKLKPENLDVLVPGSYIPDHGGKTHTLGPIPKRKARG